MNRERVTANQMLHRENVQHVWKIITISLTANLVCVMNRVVKTLTATLKVAIVIVWQMLLEKSVMLVQINSMDSPVVRLVLVMLLEQKKVLLVMRLEFVYVKRRIPERSVINALQDSSIKKMFVQVRS